MKLRYLRIGNYPPLKDVRVTFAGKSPIDRQCAIRFIVGVNGSGKSHMLQAVSEAFLALSDWRVPHFPITIVYELVGKLRSNLPLGSNDLFFVNDRKTIIIAA